jgi:hypothetical protein
VQEPTEYERHRDQTERDVERVKISAERANVMTQARAQILNEGSKGLTLINGGGAAALAAFLQAIWEKTDAIPMRWWILFGMCWLVAGTAISAINFLTRYLGSFHEKATRPMENPWWWGQIATTLLGFACFIVGMSMAIVGGFIALKAH